MNPTSAPSPRVTDAGAGLSPEAIASNPVNGYAEIDLDAIASNIGVCRERAQNAQVMAILKGDAYGHGLVPVAQRAIAAGASHLGIASLDEALLARRAGITAPILTWLYAPGADLASALTCGLTVSASSLWQLEAIAQAAADTGHTATVHLKADTGLGRGGAWGDDWRELVAQAATLQAEQRIDIEGIWSHFAYADAPEHPTVRAQEVAFAQMLEEAAKGGVRPRIRHLANSAAILTNPAAHYDMVRAGLAIYGLSPIPDQATPEQLGLREAMRLMGRLANVKAAPAGQGVSYGHTYRTPAATRLGLVPLGYADGVPRAAGNAAPVGVGSQRLTIAGRVCMDQFVLDLGAQSQSKPGDEVVLFGVGALGEPTAQDWAEAVGTINYEIVTRVCSRLPRVYLGQP